MTKVYFKVHLLAYRSLNFLFDMKVVVCVVMHSANLLTKVLHVPLGRVRRIHSQIF